MKNKIYYLSWMVLIIITIGSIFLGKFAGKIFDIGYVNIIRMNCILITTIGVIMFLCIGFISIFSIHHVPEYKTPDIKVNGEKY